MQDFADMAEAHEWTLRRLREMAGRLTEQAYLRASKAAAGQDDEAHARWMLVFDRMARGLRLSIALEAKLSRERRWDADEIEREAQGVRHAPRWRKGADGDSIPRPVPGRGMLSPEPCESDRERDDDGLACDAPLSERIDRLKTIIEGAGSPEPQSRPGRAERQALDIQRAERARRAATPWAPDEPWDILDAADRAEAGDPPWRSSG
jgi:hypothetical protein